MRDPARIDRIIEKLRLAWKETPDQRLGQLLVNLAYADNLTPSVSDVWVMEDEKWEAAIDYWLAD